MDNTLSDFPYTEFQLETNNTNPDKLLLQLKNFVDSSQSNVSFIDKASIFLNDEQDTLKEYIYDTTLHYIYKRIFNEAVHIFKEHSTRADFLEHFIKYFINNYVVNIIDSTELEIFAEEIFILIQAPKKSDLKSWSKRLKIYATENDYLNCYICGKDTENKRRKDSISFSDWLKPKDNPKYKHFLKDIYNVFGKFKIKKSISNKNKMLDEIIDVFYKHNTFEYFKKEHKKAHAHFNELSMEIEHNFPKSWGGSKNLENLFVSCHKCNQDKKDITFYSEYSISRFFSNQTDMQEAAKSLRSKLGIEALLSLKMKQQFSCSHEDCNNSFNSFNKFYISKIDNKKGFYYFNLQIECYSCIKSNNAKKIYEIGESDFFKESYIKLYKEKNEN